MDLKPGYLATLIGIAGNFLLCVLKLSVGILTSSLAVLSDGLNSLTDLVSSIAIFIAVRVSSQEADEGHPFGHHRAEPIAGLIVAIFAGIAGFEILKEAVVRLYEGGLTRIVSIWPFLVLIVSVAIKLTMAMFFYRVGRRINSPAILAGAVDSRNDILVSLTALAAVTGAYAGFPWLDAAGALVISIFIFRSGYRIGRDNIDYLMGKRPGDDALQILRKTILKDPDVGQIDKLLAHYVGNYIHVEVEIAAQKPLTGVAFHDLEERVKADVEKIRFVDKAFVHVNPTT